jgi:hypothetical protein
MVPAAALLALIVMLLWNAVMPAVFVGSRTMDYPHALGLLVLSRILFGGFRGRGGWHQRRHWRRWEALTPEEREQFKQNTGFSGCKGRGERT